MPFLALLEYRRQLYLSGVPVEDMPALDPLEEVEEWDPKPMTFYSPKQEIKARIAKLEEQAEDIVRISQFQLRQLQYVVGVLQEVVADIGEVAEEVRQVRDLVKVLKKNASTLRLSDAMDDDTEREGPDCPVDVGYWDEFGMEGGREDQGDGHETENHYGNGMYQF
ncbi:hypothetical protein NMY22_g18229 [Coprinellus aureogranulatus]|nr:hypothetical protein NMY22_g18229 [Coprinellus aureogranulatus]